MRAIVAFLIYLMIGLGESASAVKDGQPSDRSTLLLFVWPVVVGYALGEHVNNQAAR